MPVAHPPHPSTDRSEPSDPSGPRGLAAPSEPPDTYSLHPPAPRWTHVALRVSDIDASIAWYAAHTPLKLLDRRADDAGYAAWLGHDDSPDNPFVLVLAQFLPESDPFGSVPMATLAPFAHLGMELTSRAELEAAARAAREQGCLVMAPSQMPAPIGYICMLSDPDGNMIELSYDQGVYAHAQEIMRPRNNAPDPLTPSAHRGV